MFLDWIAQLRLLQHDTQTNILGSLPLQIRRTLIAEITGYLQPSAGKPPPDPIVFVSPAHVKWFMEVVGQGFNLPLEDMNITEDDIDIYARWLFEQNTRPVAVNTGGLEQEFYQIIFQQYSLLFQPRISRTSPPPPPPPPPPNYPSSNKGGFPLSVLPVHTLGTPITFATSNSTQTTIHTTTIPSNSNSTTHLLKETLGQLVKRHIELCKKTLKVFAMAARTLKLSTETWTALLKVMLGITDYLLKESTGDVNGLGVLNMSDELCDHLLQVLFEVWLRSRTMEVEMWNILKTCFSRWSHRPQAIQQWSLISLALTKRVQTQVYGNIEGNDTLNLCVNGLNIRLDLPSDFIQYAWHRMIYLIPHPLQLPPHNFTIAMLSIGQFVDAFLDTEMECPNGNTLLHMFGSYLFDAAIRENKDPESEKGSAESIATLCKIFCQPQKNQPFLRSYLEKFYAALTIGLKSDACLPTILCSCSQLFTSSLDGVFMLVPQFIVAIKRVLPKMKIEGKLSMPSDNLRLAAIKVLSTVLCLPNHFNQLELQPGWDHELQLESTSMDQDQLVHQLIRVLYTSANKNNPAHPALSLKFYILETLLMSLCTEISSYNMRYLLHLINVYVIEEVPFCVGLVGTVVKLIQDKILTMQLPADVTLVAFDVLMEFVDLYEYVKRDSKNVARELVLALCRYVDTLLSTGRIEQTYPLIVQAYDCMIKWILVSQWIVDDNDCYKAVIATLSMGISLLDREPASSTGAPEPPNTNTDKKKRRDTTFQPTKQLFQIQPRSKGSFHVHHHELNQTSQLPTRQPNHRKEELAVKMTAENCMSQLVNQLGRFSAPENLVLPGHRSKVADDIGRVKQYKESYPDESITRCPIRYFLIEKQLILSIIDITDDMPIKEGETNPSPAVLMIIRDSTGRYVWSFRTQYVDHISPVHELPSLRIDTIPESVLETSDTHDVTIPTTVAVNEDEIPHLDQIFIPNTEEWKQWEMVKSLMRKEETAYNKRPIEPSQSTEILPAGPNINPHSVRGFRLLLSQLGFFLPQNRSLITPIQINDAFISEIETLDMLNERDSISISAYYAQSGNLSLTELVEPAAVSEHFMQFLTSLGWPVYLESHEGFRGKLDKSVCDKAPYYSDRYVEFIVNVPYLLKEPSTDSMEWGNGNTIMKINQQISSDDHVCVIWIEDIENYKSLAKKIKHVNSKSMVYLFINPLKKSKNSLYWIRIFIPSIGNNASNVAASHRLNENALIFGPLIDGIVVNRHTIGSMVRSTAISAHQACRVVTDTYSRPYVTRKEYIEEMSHRHQSKMSLSEFYNDIFSVKA
ncbi:hypothetical protein BDB01DRAFT_789543 [Pilobolus umbonatus]|nr:hypothetical protein BDB01DRAFT_789543 [Pilobolus umbonatus]